MDKLGPVLKHGCGQMCAKHSVHCQAKLHKIKIENSAITTFRLPPFVHRTPHMLIHELRLPFQEGFPGHKQYSFFCRIVSDAEESV
jgi:hypothetical protein